MTVVSEHYRHYDLMRLKELRLSLPVGVPKGLGKRNYKEYRIQKRISKRWHRRFERGLVIINWNQ